MRFHRNPILILALIAATTGAAAAADLQLAAPGPNDQTPGKLVAASSKGGTARLDRTPVAISWALDPAAALAAAPVPFVRESREYWRDATAAELHAGVKLPTTAPQALIRLSPRAGNAATLTADQLVVRANGRQYAASEALQSLADASALRSAGMDVPEGSVVAKLSATVGAGDIELAVPSASGSYLVHVFEPKSTQTLNLGATRDTVIAGNALTIHANFAGATAQKATGMISAPDGHTQDVTFALGADGTFTATVVPDPAHAGGPALWEVHAFAEGQAGKQRVLRDARTAFAVSTPTARLTGGATNASARQSVSFDVGVEAASASRYQLSGVLYGRGKDGSAQPFAYAQSAAWLDAGNGTIALRFEGTALSAKLAAPYELRDLRLVNQADMSLIERREQAFTVR